jgi:hypothetical protein
METISGKIQSEGFDSVVCRFVNTSAGAAKTLTIEDPIDGAGGKGCCSSIVTPMDC